MHTVDDDDDAARGGEGAVPSTSHVAAQLASSHSLKETPPSTPIPDDSPPASSTSTSAQSRALAHSGDVEVARAFVQFDRDFSCRFGAATSTWVCHHTCGCTSKDHFFSEREVAIRHNVCTGPHSRCDAQCTMHKYLTLQRHSAHPSAESRARWAECQRLAGLASDLARNSRKRQSEDEVLAPPKGISEMRAHPPSPLSSPPAASSPPPPPPPPPGLAADALHSPCTQQLLSPPAPIAAAGESIYRSYTNWHRIGGSINGDGSSSLVETKDDSVPSASIPPSGPDTLISSSSSPSSAPPSPSLAQPSSMLPVVPLPSPSDEQHAADLDRLRSAHQAEVTRLTAENDARVRQLEQRLVEERAASKQATAASQSAYNDLTAQLQQCRSQLVASSSELLRANHCIAMSRFEVQQCQSRLEAQSVDLFHVTRRLAESDLQMQSLQRQLVEGDTEQAAHLGQLHVFSLCEITLQRQLQWAQAAIRVLQKKERENVSVREERDRAVAARATAQTASSQAITSHRDAVEVPRTHHRNSAAHGFVLELQLRTAETTIRKYQEQERDLSASRQAAVEANQTQKRDSAARQAALKQKLQVAQTAICVYRKQESEHAAIREERDRAVAAQKTSSQRIAELESDLLSSQQMCDRLRAVLPQTRQRAASAECSRDSFKTRLVTVKQERFDFEESAILASHIVVKATAAATRAESLKRKAEDDAADQQRRHEERVRQHQVEQRRLEEQLENEQLRLTCSACLDAPPAVLYLPCGHATLCEKCDEKMQKRRCPKCQKKIRKQHRAYL